MNILEEANEITQNGRRKSYGHPLDHFSRTVGTINVQFEAKVRRRLEAGLPMFEPEDWAKMIMIDKLSRSMEADKRDNLVDIAGYARTHEMVCEERERRKFDAVKK